MARTVQIDKFALPFVVQCVSFFGLGWVDQASGHWEEFQRVISWVEGIIVKDEVVGVVFLHASYCPPEIIRTRYLKGISEENIPVV
jgi:hypothetical protein